MFAESSLSGSAGGAMYTNFYPIEVGIKLLLHSPSSNNSPLEIRLGYFLSRSYTGEDREEESGWVNGQYTTKVTHYLYEKYSTFYVGVAIHI